MNRTASLSLLPVLLVVTASFVFVGCTAGGSDVPHDPQGSTTDDAMPARAINASDTVTGAAANDSASRAEAAARAAARALAVTFPEIRYSQMHIATRAILDSLRRKYGKTE